MSSTHSLRRKKRKTPLSWLVSDGSSHKMSTFTKLQFGASSAHPAAAGMDNPARRLCWKAQVPASSKWAKVPWGSSEHGKLIFFFFLPGFALWSCFISVGFPLLSSAISFSQIGHCCVWKRERVLLQRACYPKKIRSKTGEGKDYYQLNVIFACT